MRERGPPPATPGPLPRDAADWHPVGGALAASIALHALAIASLTVLYVHPLGVPGRPGQAAPLYAVLAGATHPEPSAPQPLTAPARPPSPRPAIANRAAAPRDTTGVAPWSSLPATVDLPPGMSGTTMVSEGLEFIETRNVVRLGVDVERRIRAEFPDEPEYPVVLGPAETLGYPVDALIAGIEGSVLVWFGVDEEGKVVAKEGLDGPPELLEWVLDRLDRLVARPAMTKLGPVRGWVAVEIVFDRATAEAARTAQDPGALPSRPRAVKAPSAAVR